MVPDGELLREYVKNGSEAAFATLVQRHVNLVYRTAIRRVGGNAHAADDVTQRVFTALARKAVVMQSHPSIAGWLYTSTRFAAAELVRGEQRRRKHEERAQLMNEINATTTATDRIEPFLDELLSVLPERDRELVLRHFFEGQSFVDVAATVKSSADATRMRVNRALDRMRQQLAKRGITSTGAALGAALASHSAAAASLPNVAMLATKAIADAGAISATGWFGAHLLHTVKSAPWLTASVATVAVVGVAVSFRPAAEPPPQTVALRQTTLPASSHAPPQPTPVGETPSPSLASTPAADVPPSTASSGAAPSAYDRLSPEEKNLLAVLWRLHVSALPGTKSILSIGRAAPNNDAIDPLLRRGFVAEDMAAAPAHRRVSLTSQGIHFCEANEAAIEAIAPVANLKKAPEPR